MKKLLTLLMLIFISSISFSQEIEDEEESEDAIFIYVNRMPRFPGGNLQKTLFILNRHKYKTYKALYI